MNVLWAAHQVHHSSEEYNLSTALRQSVVQKWLNLVRYLPAYIHVPVYTHTRTHTHTHN